MRPRAEMVNDVRPGWREGFGLSLAGLLLLAGSSGNAAVVINELSAAASSRQLSWSSNGVPRLGSGVAWMEPGFTPRGWSRGLLPAGYGFGGLATDLTEAMKDKAPSLYLRREFDLTAAEAAHTDPLVLWVDYNDGFVAYLNGIEVARAHCGPTNRFMFARQPAYNVNTSTLPAQIVLGPVSALLKPGRNVLALQVHNADLPGLTNWPERITLHQPTPEFKINVALRTSGATLVNLQVDRHDFDAATGARRIHTRTNGMVADTVLGSPMAGGWIANAAPPVSSPDWQGLELVTEEAVGAGPGGSGALRITVNQSGPNQAAAVHAPEVDLAPAWPVGAVASNHLANTYVRFRSRAAGGAQFRLRIDPAPGQEASALTGFPLIAPTNEAPVTFANAANGARTMTINAAGSQSQSVVGSLASLSLVAFASNDVRNMSYRIVEDGAAGAGYNASKGHLRAEITQAASAGSAWGFSYGNFGIGTWTPGSVTPQEMAYAEVQFACRIPVGVAFDVWVEPGSGGFSNRLDWGSITGTGGWEIVRRSFAGHPNTERFRLALNAARTRNVKLFFRASAALGAGTVLQLDDLQVIPWRQYEVRLADGTNGHAAFLGFLNGQGRVSFRPALEKVSDASGGPQTLTLDDYEVVYFGTNATAVTHYVAAGPAGGLWDYFVGLAEPSGGVFDPGLLAGGVMPTPAGAENEFENPEEFVDWIELFNNGGQAIDLSGWSLTDDRDKPGKWRFPSGTMLEAGAYLLVLCDDREEANAPAGPASDLHAGFSLDGDGEYVGLFDAQGVFVDGLTSGYPKQVFFASYGRAPGNPTEFGFLTTATPGAANQGEFFARRAAAPEFRQADGTNALPGGIYSSASLTLVLTNDTPGVSIRYTLDGSEPTEFNGLAYLGPLILTQTSDRTCAVVRARAFRPGWLPSGVRTHTYVLRQPAAFTNAPALFLSAQKDRAFYKPYGILAIEGGYFHTLSAPWDQMWIANSPTSYNEALGNGAPFEREVHLEYYFPPAYYPTNQQALRVDVGLRLSASPYQRPRMRLTAAEASSPFPPSDATEKPSFNIFFNGDYGPSKLDYKLFPNYDIKEFQHLRLRAGKNDNVNPFITDELVRRLWIDLGHVGPRGLFCPLYLNGVYKGIYNLTERVRESLFQAHLHSQLDWDVCYVGDWVNGDGLAYSNLVAALDRDLSVLSNYLAAAQLFHEDNFADYYLLNIYCAMWDWPENNYVFARERSAGPLGRFIFTVWDAEGAFNINSYYNKPTSHNTLTELATKSGDVPRLWQRLILSPEFRLRFADRIHRHCFNGGV
ncbi:MAG TPA: CotH kinase family protein, partial [Methylomirabilota bacterium]|nr:CotH kinase family protein [Methylomirabilota bacterium]